MESLPSTAGPRMRKDATITPPAFPNVYRRPHPPTPSPLFPIFS